MITAASSPRRPSPKRLLQSAHKFLEFVRNGDCNARGDGGTPLILSHGFYNTVACFIQDRFHEKLGPSAALVEKMFSRFMEGRAPAEFTLKEKTEFIVEGVLSGKIFELAKPANVSLWKELSGYFARPEVKAKLAAHLEGVSEPERRTFLMANMVAEQLTFRFFNKFVQQISSGNIVESMQALSAIAPIAGNSDALYLRFSQSGALSKMVAPCFQGNDWHRSYRVAKSQTCLVH